ncbi:MAG: hypothetical protein Q7S04_00345 [Candidatus Moranbacteria bacterium]|nr:hypothetical protein [Candidatus Moranbacteria bacterium]
MEKILGIFASQIVNEGLFGFLTVYYQSFSIKGKFALYGLFWENDKYCAVKANLAVRYLVLTYFLR